MSDRSSLVNAVAILLCAAGAAVAQTTHRTSLSSAEAQPSLASTAGSITPDGRFAVFTTLANGVVPGDDNGRTDVFVRDRLLGTTARVSVPDPSTGNPQSNEQSYICRPGARCISDDGRFVVFTSYADNLVAGDTNLVADIFVRDRDADSDGIFDESGIGATRTVRVSLTSSEGQSFGSCPNQTCTHGAFDGTISADGRFVAFESEFNFAGNVDFANIYVRDRDADNDGIFDEPGGSPNAATTELVSVPVTCQGCAQDGFSGDAAISADGRYIAFVSRSTHIVFSDFNQSDDIFVRDIVADTTVRVSVSTAGAEGDTTSDCASPAISGDGRFVAFSSISDDLVANDGPNTDVFVRDRDTDSDGIFDEPAAVSTEIVSLGWAAFPLPAHEVNLNGASWSPSISGDGRFVAFNSDSTNFSCSFLSCEDQNGMTDVLVRDRALAVTRRVSLTISGFEPTGGASSGPALSADGRHCAFTSTATNINSPDDNGATADAYIRSGLLAPDNDTCAGAIPVQAGDYYGDSWGAAHDGASLCESTPPAPDVVFSYTAACTGAVVMNTMGSIFDTVLSVHSDCPATTSNQIICNDDFGGTLQSQLTVNVVAGAAYTIRLTGFFSGGSGLYHLGIADCIPAPCACDYNHNGTLNSQDYFDFLSDFFAGDSVADINDDNTVNSQDYFDFLTCFFTGC
jgi:Tol biopolymer transport system component